MMTFSILRSVFRWKVILVSLLLAATYAASNIDTVLVFCTRNTHLQSCWDQETSPVMQLLVFGAFILAIGGWILLAISISIIKEETDPEWRKRLIWSLCLFWPTGSILWYLPLHFIAEANQPDALRILQSWPGLFGSFVACTCLGTLFEVFIGGNIIEKWRAKEQHRQDSPPNPNSTDD